jgi:TP901 family phage tail tape measure protein
MAGNRWGFVFSVETREFEKLTRSYRQIRDITESVDALGGKLKGVVAGMADEIKSSVETIKQSVRSVQDLVNQGRQTFNTTRTATTAPVLQPGSVQSSSPVIIEGRVREYLRKEFGVSKYALEKYNRPYVRERTNVPDPNDPTRTIRRFQDVRDADGHRIRNPIGPAIPIARGQSITQNQALTLAARTNITGPIVEAINSLRSEMRGMRYGGASHRSVADSPTIGAAAYAPAAPITPAAPPMNYPDATAKSRSNRPSRAVRGIDTGAAARPSPVTSREAIYGYLAQYVGKDEFTEFQRNPAAFGLGKLSQLGVVKKANPKDAEALVRGMLKSIEQQSQSLAEQYTNIMAVATAGQQKGFEHFINASKNMYARKASGATQAEMTGEGAAGLITQQIKSQVSAHAAMTDLLGIDPGSGIKSVLTRYKEASTLLGSTKEGDESAFVRSLQDRVFTPSPVFGNNLFPRPTAGEKSEHANEKQVSEGKPSKKMVFSNYRFTDRDEHILNAAEAAADEAKIHDEQQRSEFQFSAVLADSIRQGLKSGKINPAARSKNSAKNYLTGEGFQRLLGTYQELGGTEDPEVLKKTIGAKANELADFIHSKSTGPGDSAASLGIRNTLQRIEENTRALKGMGHAGGGSVPALRDRTIEGHLDEAFGLPSFDKRDNFAGRFRNALGRVAIYGGGASLLYGGIGAVRGGFESAMNIDAARTQLRMVQNPLDNNSGRLIEQAKGLGEKYGVGADQIGQAMATFQREGNNTKEMLSNVDTALMATNVTEMTLLETTQALTAAEKQFGFTAQQSKQILDGWLNVQDSTAVSARTLSDALKISATSARAAGLDFHTLNGVIGAVGESTRESGERIGTSVKYIFQQMHRPKSVDALQQLGVTTEDAFGNMKSGVNVMGELASRWDKLTDAQKQNVAISIAGTEHLNDFFVMMENWDRAIDLSVSSLTSQGSAVRKNELAMESAHKKVDQLRVSLQNLWHSIIDAGALDFLKQMTDSLRGMVDLVGKVNHGSGGVLGGLAGSLGVAGAGVGAASWLTGGFLPEVLGGGFAPRGISEDMRRQRGGGGDSAASLGGVGSGTYFTPRRFGSLGLLVGSSFLQGTYNNYYRQAAPGQAPTGRDFAVDAGTSALQGAGMIGMFAKSGGLQQQGVGRMLLMSLIAAQTAGSIYSKYKTYSSGTTPGTADEAMGRYENLRAMEDKYSQGRSTLLQYVRDFKAGRNGEGMDPAKLQDMADMVAALQPGLVKFNEAGQITIKDVEGWADALTTASKRLRNERVEVLKAATAADLKSPETQKLLRQRQDLLAQRSGYGENTPLADRLGNQAAISANVEQLRGKFYNPMLAQSILAGQASGAISPFGRDDITGYASKIGMSPEQYQTEVLRRGVQGSTGLLVDVGRQLQADQKSPFDVNFYQKSRGGAVYDSSSGRVVAAAGSGAEAFSKNNYVLKAFDSKYQQGIVIGPDAQLSKLLQSLTTSLDHLSNRNAQLIAASEFQNRNLQSTVFSRTPGTGVELQELLRTGRTLNRIGTEGAREIFGPTVKLDSHTLQEEMKQLIGQASAASASNGTIAPEGLANVQKELLQRSDQFRSMAEGWVRRLIDTGGKDNVSQVNPGEEGTGLNRPYQALAEAFNTEVASQLKSFATQVNQLRSGENPSGEDKAKADQIEKLMFNLVRGQGNFNTDGANAKVSQNLADLIGRYTQFARGTAETLGVQYNAQANAGAVRNVEEFLRQPEISEATKLLQSNIETIARLLEAQKKSLEDMESSGTTTPASLEMMRKEVENTSSGLEAMQSVLTNLPRNVQVFEQGLRHVGYTIEQTIGRSNLGGAYGMTGVNAGRYSIQTLQKELEKINKQLAKTTDPTGPWYPDGAVERLPPGHRATPEPDQPDRRPAIGRGRRSRPVSAHATTQRRRRNLRSGRQYRVRAGGQGGVPGDQPADRRLAGPRPQADESPTRRRTRSSVSRSSWRRCRPREQPDDGRGLRLSEDVRPLQHLGTVGGRLRPVARPRRVVHEGDPRRRPVAEVRRPEQPPARTVVRQARQQRGRRRGVEVRTGHRGRRRTDEHDPQPDQGGDRQPAWRRRAAQDGGGIDGPCRVRRPSTARVASAATALPPSCTRARSSSTSISLGRSLENHFDTGTLPMAASSGVTNGTLSKFAKIAGRLANQFHFAVGETGQYTRLSESSEAGKLLQLATKHLGGLGYKFGIDNEAMTKLLSGIDIGYGSALADVGGTQSAANALYHRRGNPVFGRLGAGYRRSPSIEIGRVIASDKLGNQVSHAAGLIGHELRHDLTATGFDVYSLAGKAKGGQEYRDLFELVPPPAHLDGPERSDPGREIRPRGGISELRPSLRSPSHRRRDQRDGQGLFDIRGGGAVMDEFHEPRRRTGDASPASA